MGIIKITNKSQNYNLNGLQVRLDLSNLNISPGSSISLKYNDDGSNVKFCYEKSNGECTNDNTQWDTTYIWVKIEKDVGYNESIYINVYTNENTALTGFDVFDFYDDFNDGVLDWTIVSCNSWEEIDGYLHGKYDGTHLVCRVKKDFNDTGNWVYEWRSKYITTEMDSYPWLALEIKSSNTDTDNYDTGYMLTPYTDTGNDIVGNKFRIYKTSGGHIISYVEASYTIHDNQFYIWRAVYNNGNITIYDITNDNSVEVSTYSDSSYTTGQVLRLMYDKGTGDAYFDWVRVRKFIDVDPSIEYYPSVNLEDTINLNELVNKSINKNILDTIDIEESRIYNALQQINESIELIENLKFFLNKNLVDTLNLVENRILEIEKDLVDTLSILENLEKYHYRNYTKNLEDTIYLNELSKKYKTLTKKIYDLIILVDSIGKEVKNEYIQQCCELIKDMLNKILLLLVSK